ncbi:MULTISPECIES: hypothetical protein [unclassified Lysobacter]|uniref:hypothetical protein n=1 Tax=unclassified Lysobacter TaxID=2635362 RepID=UPI0007003865|nr:MULTISPECIES: hypothetical protein [unclassified Lysobacter]KQZ59493.1 hypothetical protein ASD53_04585 [Lysobacter sp. Root559]KRA75746.1 hypothetical protein ASD78_07195 [Lysobacter sp. Root667]KRC36538.1 hypothetical protein ASE10_05325 [Lysobacter sp. Root76]KRD66631.1 hypothetical protein ASE45_14975 [Lysobacter sp. Root96]
MKHGIFVLTAAAILSLSACKKAEQAAPAAEPEAAAATSAAATPAPEAAPAPAAAPAEPSAEDEERAKAQAKLDFATMEDGYLNDPKGQWATAAKASSSYGSADGKDSTVKESYTPYQAIGPANDESWSNKNQSVGFDWIELSYDKPVSASEVRVALEGGNGAKGITKIELIDTAGQAHTVWSGLSDSKRDERGGRTWIVRKFEPTAYQAKSVKVTFANNVENGYSYVDAVQLVGG